MGLKAGVVSLWRTADFSRGTELGWHGSACRQVFPPSGQQQTALPASSLRWQVTSYNVIKSMLKPHPGAQGYQRRRKQTGSQVDPCHSGEGSSAHCTRTTLRGGNSRAAGEGHTWHGAHWDYREAAAPGIPALGAALARGRGSRETDMQTDFHWAGGQTQRWHSWVIRADGSHSQKTLPTSSKALSPKNPSLRTLDFPEADFSKFTLAAECPSIPGS